MFSVQIESTQDINSQDQCSVILRYVINVIHERLVAVVKCEASTGQCIAQLLTEVVEKLKFGYLASVSVMQQMELLCCPQSPPIQYMCGAMYML